MTLTAAFVQTPSSFVASGAAPKTAVTVFHAAASLFDGDAATALVTSSLNIATEASTTTFEPVLPSTPALIGMTSVIALCVVAAVVWSESVVPVSRTKLALSKKNGQVKEYLDDLQENGEEKPLETWLFTDWLQARSSSNSTNSRKKEPALPILKKAKWNSGDNPVVVTSAMLMVGILVAAITERVTT